MKEQTNIKMDYIPNPKYDPHKTHKHRKTLRTAINKKTGPFGIMKFSQIEIRHLFWGWLAISVAFANILKSSNVSFWEAFLISAIAVGLGFILHEMGHKYFSQKYGIWAEFRASYTMLFFAVITSLFGIVIAAPGAVMIFGRPTKKQNGIISLAGPAVNLVLAILFFAVFFFFGSNNDFLLKLSTYGFMINSWLALFNLLPFFIFDGRKIFEWSKAVWGLMFGISIVFLFMQGVLFSI